MGTGFAEAPLAVFTTLAPMGAAAFIVLLLAQMKGIYAGAASGSAGSAGDAGRRIDKLTLIPVVVVLLGFVGAFFHLANPLAAFGVVDGIGRSPLSNEVLAGGVFVAVAIVYAVLAWTGKFAGSARTAALAVVSVLAVVFAVFCGLAYMMDTIPAWNQPSTVAQMLGFALLGGALLGALVLAVAKADVASVRMPVLVMAVVGLVLAVAGFGMQIAACGGIYTIWGSAADAVPAAWIVFGALLVGGVAACALLFAALKRQPANVTLAAVAVAIFVVTVFLARIVFYGLHVTL